MKTYSLDQFRPGKSENVLVGACCAHDGILREISVNRLGYIYERFYNFNKGTVDQITRFNPKKPEWSYHAVELSGVGKKISIYRAIALSNIGNAEQMDAKTYRALRRAIFKTGTVRSDGVIRSRFDAHHVDGNHDNNKRGNLILVTTSDHRHLHDLISKCGLAIMNGSEKDAKYYKRVYHDLIKKARTVEYILGEVRLF